MVTFTNAVYGIRNQFDSRSALGDSAWRYTSREPTDCFRPPVKYNQNGPIKTLQSVEFTWVANLRDGARS